MSDEEANDEQKADAYGFMSFYGSMMECLQREEPQRTAIGYARARILYDAGHDPEQAAAILMEAT